MGSLLSRLACAGYGALALALSAWVLVRVAPIAFGAFLSPGPPGDPTAGAILTDLLLVGVFGLQHSAMARPAFKSAYRRALSPATLAATYTLASSLALALLVWQWRPVPGVVWRIDAVPAAAALRVLGIAGWGLVLVSFVAMNAPRLLGAEQVVAVLRRRPVSVPQFRTPGPYRWVRHPILLGFAIGHWVTPVMTADRFLLAIAMSVYIAVGLVLEERDLVDEFGEAYRAYRRRVPTILPGTRRDD